MSRDFMTLDYNWCDAGEWGVNCLQCARVDKYKYIPAITYARTMPRHSYVPMKPDCVRNSDAAMQDEERLLLKDSNGK